MGFRDADMSMELVAIAFVTFCGNIWCPFSLIFTDSVSQS